MTSPGEEQSLAADRGSRLGGAAAPEERPRHLLAVIAAASLLAHGCLLFAFAFLDAPPNLPAPVHEIPVEVVRAPPAQEKSPAAAGESKPQAGAAEKPKPANPPSPPPTAKPATPSAAPNPASNKPIDASRKERGPKLSARQKAATQRSTAVAAWQMGSIGAGAVAGVLPGSPFGIGPDRFHAVDVPLPGESGDEAMSYKMIVGGVLERAKQYPESARQRRAKGIAIVGFDLDASGGVTSVVLLQSSGEADLDAEGLALVKRAAPFPPPPPGAQHSFTIEIAFGMGK